TLLRGGYATAASGFRLEYQGEFRPPASRRVHSLNVLASQVETLRFHGFGNETVLDRPEDAYKLRQRQLLIEAAASGPLGKHLRLSAGPVLKLVDTHAPAGSLLEAASPYGAGWFRSFGFRSALHLDSRDRRDAPGLAAAVSGSAYPALWSVRQPFGDFAAQAVATLAAPGWASLLPSRPTLLALRAAARTVWGEAPFHEAAFLGGEATVRGFHEQRWAGDAAVWGNAELRVPAGSFRLAVPVDYGVLALADAGRVFLDRERSGRWHAAAGGGMWFEFVDPQHTLVLTLAGSAEGTAFYAGTGFLF
ncbi:MAG: hypothetical protein HY703_07735, partial [Gemmatimonadetes bacterium]|nr:hypothetical protein [Gemmatimonadota bacterium]